jgi:glycosyltransferase involved in cell wall biosynthesis
MKLNLGCGTDHMAGWVNVDRFPASNPDRVVDLEQIPWPLEDNCADEILLKHVLEHLGKDTDTFLGIMGELYRICRPGALVRIWVPHPRHTDFLADPTHVRPVLPDLFYHFSYDINVDWQGRGLPGTPLAMYLGLDFRIEKAMLHLDPHWHEEVQSGRVKGEELEFALRTYNNVAQQVEVELRAIKPFRGRLPAAEAKPGPRLRAIWEGTFFRNHSLSKINRELGARLGADPTLELATLPYEPDDFDPKADPRWAALAARQGARLTAAAQVHVRHQWPPKWEAPASGAWVLMQPWEFGPVPKAWLPHLAQVDEIWVPSTQVRAGYVRSGVDPSRVQVIPNGVDTTCFTPEGPAYPLPFTKGCTFLFLGGTIGRKGIDVLLKAWRRAFTAQDDVALVIKGNPAGAVYSGAEIDAEVRALQADAALAPVLHLPLDLTEAQVAALYRACQAFVLPYRGEGFGMPIAEAMACGLPVLVTGAGASQDFCDASNAVLLPSRPVAFAELDGLPAAVGNYHLEEPDEDALVEALRRVAGDPALRRRLGAAGRQRILEAFTWEHMAAKVRERIAVLAEVEPVRMTPPPVRHQVVFVHRVTDLAGPWLTLTLAYARAFQPGDSVLLVLDRSRGPREADLQEVLMAAFAELGVEAFPDLAIISKAQELGELLEAAELVRWLEDPAEALPSPETLALALRLKAHG